MNNEKSNNEISNNNISAIKKRFILIIFFVFLISSFFTILHFSNNTNEVEFIEKVVSVDYNDSPEQILLSYTEEGMREFKNVYPIKQNMDYALTQIGKIAPNFEFYKLNGELIKLSDLKGKNIIIDVSKTTCTSCGLSTPIFEEVSNDVKYQDIVFLSIFPKDNKESIEKYYADLNLDINNNTITGVDNGANMTFVNDYNITQVPSFIYIDSDSKISLVTIGDLDKVYLEESIERAFGDNKLYSNLKTEKVPVDKDGNSIEIDPSIN